MGAHGPLPAHQPTNIRQLRGEALHAKPAPSLKANPKAPALPEAWLASGPKYNPLRRKVWRATVRNLDELGVLAKADVEILRSFTEAVVLRERVLAELEDQTLTVRTENGNFVRNPNLTTLNEAQGNVEKFARQLGCTPAIRLRMPRPEPDDEDLSL